MTGATASNRAPYHSIPGNVTSSSSWRGETRMISIFFVSPTLPHKLHRKRRLLRGAHAPICVQTPPSEPEKTPTPLPSDQFTQYAARDKNFLKAEQTSLRASTHLHRHHHIFLQSPSATAFRSAATRFLSARPPSEARLWFLRSTADPTFGTLRGEPAPPRLALLETFPTGLPQDEDPVLQWITALDRAGRALSPMPSHYVDWVPIGAAGIPDPPRPPAVVAFEILNSDWTRPATVPEMRRRLLEHAAAVVDAGSATFYEVFQSPDEPTCFKSVEVYSSLEALRHHMDTLDPPFEQSMLQCRAAVNRVRQLYNPYFPAPP